MKLLIIFLVLILVSASTCGGGGNGAGAGGGGAVPEMPAQPEPYDEAVLTLPEAIEPTVAVGTEELAPLWPEDLPDIEHLESLEELAPVWPADLPKIDDLESYEFVEGFKSEDGKHLKKVFLTSEKTHTIIRTHFLKLFNKGYDDRQVMDSENFAHMEFTNGETLVVLTVNYDSELGKNRVEISVHLK